MHTLRAMHTLCAMLFGFLLSFASISSAAPLTSLSAYPSARCMDGTFSGYYFQAATTAANSTKWVINLEGGGECATKDSCYSKLNGPLGSSKYFASEKSDFGQFASSSCNENPDMCTWNHVHIPYCSQDLHSGQRNVTSDDTWGLYFAGHYVFTAVIDDLVVHHGLAQAAEIILTGESAGGIGTWYHMDDLAVQFSSARVAGAPIAGFYFFADPYQGVNHTQSELADFREAAWPSHFELWHPHVDAGCAEHYGSDNAWMCMLSNQSFPFISTPVFVTEAQTDQVVILGHDWIPAQYIYEPPEQQYVAEWAANMSAALKPVMESPKDGVFNPACFIHTSFSMGSPIIANLSYIETFGNWYFRRSGPKQLEDNCGIFCNPSCNPPAQ